jgi:hypothetical protein
LRILQLAHSSDSSSPGNPGPIPNLLAHQPPVSTSSNTLLHAYDAPALYGWTHKTNVWLWLIVVSFLKLKLSPTPGFSIDCCVPLHACIPQSVTLFCRSLPPTCESPTNGYLVVACCLSSNLSVASPLRAATKRFFHFLVVACCLAHGFDMMPPVHSEVLSSIVNMLHALRGLFFLVDMLLPVVHSAVTSPFLPSACRVYCPYLLLCFFHGRFSRHLPVGPLTVTRRYSLIHLLLLLLLLSIVQSFSRSVVQSPLTSLLVSICCSCNWDGHNGTVR